MVFTLHRYVFRELLRIFLLATIGLTLILSLGAILRPVQEFGLGPRQVLHVLTCFLPISLTFVLPVAALFASALTYGRFAVDNEIDACRASGVSLLTLIYPGFVLALLVAIANLLLSFHVMPYFVHLAETSLRADAKQILFRNIQRKGYYSLPPEQKYFIYADYADSAQNTLFGIVVVQYENGRVKRIITSDATQVQFDPHDRFNEMRLVVSHARQIGEAANDYWGEIGSLLLKKEFGSLLGDKIKFKKVEDVKRIRTDLMQFDPIAKIARSAYVQLATERLARDMAEAVSPPRSGCYELQGNTRSVRLWATTCTLDKPMVITLRPPIIVEEYDRRTGERPRRLQCERGEIYVEEDPAQPRLGLSLHSARDEQGGSLLVQYVIPDLALPAEIRQSLESTPILQEVSSPKQVEKVLGGPPSSILAKQQAALAAIIAHTEKAIQAEMNLRLVFGIGCIPMILIGIGLGIFQRGSHLLSAFGASCIPGAILGASIICGKRLIEGTAAQGFSGLLVMWGGLAFLTLLAVWVCGRLLRR